MTTLTAVALAASACIAVPVAEAADYLRQSLSGAFVYAAETGPYSYPPNDAPGYGMNYSFRPRRWLAIEAGLQQIVRPIGFSYCCRYGTNANDELYLVPFGARYVLDPKGGRVRLSIGGGGAYIKYAVGNSLQGTVTPFAGWGGQFVASGDYGLTRSGRLRERGGSPSSTN